MFTLTNGNGLWLPCIFFTRRQWQYSSYHIRGNTLPYYLSVLLKANGTYWHELFGKLFLHIVQPVGISCFVNCCCTFSSCWMKENANSVIFCKFNFEFCASDILSKLKRGWKYKYYRDFCGWETLFDALDTKPFKIPDWYQIETCRQNSGLLQK